MKTEYKKQFHDLAVNSIKSVVVVLSVMLLFIVIAHFSVGFNVDIFRPSIIIGIIGTTIAYIGNSFVADSATRFGSINLPQWKYGNILQSIGFGITLIALLSS